MRGELEGDSGIRREWETQESEGNGRLRNQKGMGDSGIRREMGDSGIRREWETQGLEGGWETRESEGKCTDHTSLLSLPRT